MAPKSRRSADAWALARRQHGVVTRAQLLAAGFTSDAIQHRLERARLHVVYRGVYAVGRRELTQLGVWMAAVLRCGPGAALSHRSAAALWRIAAADRLEVTVAGGVREVPGIVVHRCELGPADATVRFGIPVTRPVRTLVDVAATASQDELEAAVNAADRLGVVDLQTLRRALDAQLPRRGVGVLRRLLDRRTFTFTRSQLERRFIPITLDAGLPMPQTCVTVNGFEVDFYWAELGLIVETDGLTYHRTPAQQARDRLRDQVHTAAGITTLRFTHAQVRDDPEHVRRILARTASRLAA